MRQPPNENAKPPGIISTLSAGFDLTTNNIWLIILPILLDLFFWLGPRLSIEHLVAKNLAMLGSEPAFLELVDQFSNLAAEINLFTSLSLPLIGIPALMSGPIPDSTPISPRMIQINDSLTWFGLFLLFSLVGLILSAVYLGLIGRVLRESKNDVGVDTTPFLQSTLRITLRLLGLGLFFMFVLIAVAVPVLPVAIVISLFAANLAMVLLFTAFILVVTFMSFSVPGIVLNDRPVVRAVVDSVHLVRRNLSPTLNLLIAVLLISSGMNFLWHLADDGSWLTLASIAGHAFITTALFATIFIFYRDRFTRLFQYAPPQ